MGTHKTGMPTQGSTPGCRGRPRGALGAQLPIIPGAHNTHGHSSSKTLLCVLLSVICSEFPSLGPHGFLGPRGGLHSPIQLCWRQTATPWACLSL